MKVIKRNKSITAAEMGQRTVWYEADLDMVRNALREENLILYGAIQTHGFDAIKDIDMNIPGSYIDDVEDRIYICVTDGSQVVVDGEEVDPDEAMEEYGPEALEGYILPATNQMIVNKLTSYEINNYDLDLVAQDLMDESYSFIDIYEAYKDIAE